MKYKDYYQILGVQREATQEQIQKAYRALARKYHPDINKSPDAEERFKDINEAYDVLKDPEKRKKYDTLGANWRHGQDFTPPPGWSGATMDFGDIFASGDFGDFFEAFFSGGASRSRRSSRVSRKGEDRTAEIEISLEDAYTGATKEISFTTLEVDGSGRNVPRTKTLSVTIPKGITDGKRIRLPGQGGPPSGGGTPGDLFIRVKIAPSQWKLEDRDISVELPITPSEAALGGEAELKLPDGKTVSLKIPPCSSSGARLRLRGKGMPGSSGNDGDLFVVLKVVLPKSLSDAERELYAKLAKTSGFKPRS